jgi:hypothetical protein
MSGLVPDISGSQVSKVYKGPLPLRTLDSLITLSPQTLAPPRLSKGNFGSPPLNPFGF